MFSQIYISASITAAIILFIVYLFCRWGRLGFQKGLAFILFALPLSAVVNLMVKKPILLYILHSLNLNLKPLHWPVQVMIFTLLLVGFSEEGVKMLPVIIPKVRREISRSKFNKLALSWLIGVGFGIGEAYYIAYNISLNPELSGYPYYYFTGFMGERVMASLVHGVFTAAALYGWPTPIYLIKTYVVASILHALTDIFPLLYQAGYLDIFLTESIIALITMISLFSYLYIVNKAKEACEEYP